MAATAIVVACSDTGTFKELKNETELIGFRTNHENITRAAVTAPSGLTDANGGFGVYGFKHKNDRAADSNNHIDLSDNDPQTNGENYVQTIFNNVKVWYVEDATTKDFTYAVPRYWDVEKFYTFFAYAPHATVADANQNPAVKGIAFDQSTGLFTRNDILSVQDASAHDATTPSAHIASASSTDYHFTDAVESSIVDYLFGSYVPHQKKGSTNQSEKTGPDSYTGKELTVGFTFSHILSKLNVTVKALQSSASGFHGYKGIKDIKVTKLSIANLPAKTPVDVTYSQTGVNSAAGSFSPSAFTSTSLDMINTASGADATSTDALYILYGGSISGTTITNPTTFWDQSFHYYVTPNDPGENNHYTLDLDYTITYVDGTVDEYTRSINLKTLTGTTAFASMQQAYVYNITVTISLDQIYFTVESTGNWTDHVQNTDVNVE